MRRGRLIFGVAKGAALARVRFHAVVLLILAGCVSEPASPPDMDLRHPANPKARVPAYQAPADVLKSPMPDPPIPSTPPEGEKELSRALPGEKELPPEVRKVLEEILQACEGIRAALAADEVDSVPVSAKALAKAADQAVENVSGDWKETLQEIAGYAASLDPVPPLELEAARKNFGEVSRRVIRIVSRVPILRGERKIFFCSMWNKGYAKWIQVDDTLSNPYLGKGMLRCGVPSEWQE